MAMAKLGVGFTELEGTIGGTVFRKDVCGQHAQSLPRRIKRESPLQREQRMAFLKAVHFCSEATLMGNYFGEWWLYAVKHPKTNSKGERIILTPMMACVRVNTVRFRNNVDPLEQPPE